MKNKIVIIIETLIIISLILSIIIILTKCNKQEEPNILVPDTTYNHIVLDSIEYNIRQKDTIIYNYKQELKYEIEKNNSSADSDAIKLFYKLLSE